MTEPCDVCGRKKGERVQPCIRCADRPLLRRLPQPLPGKYLVVDPGACSGWCIVQAHAFLDDQLCILESGACGVWTTEPERVVTVARAEGCEALIYEQQVLGGAGRMTPIAVESMGAAVGVWKWNWRVSQKAKDRSVVLGIPAITWRATVIGGGQRTTDEWKADAQKHVKNAYPSITQSDECDAVCLAEHALTSLDVVDAIGSRRLGQLGWKEPKIRWAKDGATFTRLP